MSAPTATTKIREMAGTVGCIPANNSSPIINAKRRSTKVPPLRVEGATKNANASTAKMSRMPGANWTEWRLRIRSNKSRGAHHQGKLDASKS